MRSKDCADAVDAHPLNKPFDCCFQTQDGGSAVAGEIRQGSTEDWIATADLVKTFAKATVVAGVLAMLYPAL